MSDVTSPDEQAQYLNANARIDDAQNGGRMGRARSSDAWIAVGQPGQAGGNVHLRGRLRDRG